MASKYIGLCFVILFNLWKCNGRELDDPFPKNEIQELEPHEFQIDKSTKLFVVPVLIPPKYGNAQGCCQNGEQNDSPVRRQRTIGNMKSRKHIIYSPTIKNNRRKSFDNYRRSLPEPPKEANISQTVLKDLEAFIVNLKNDKLIDVTPELYTFVLTYKNLPELISKIIKVDEVPENKINTDVIMFFFDLMTKNITDENEPLLKKSVRKALRLQSLRKQNVEFVTSGVIEWAQHNHYFEFHRQVARVLVSFIFGIAHYQYFDISINQLDIILNMPHLANFIHFMLTSYGIPSILTPEEIVLLLELMRSYKYNMPLRDVPLPVIQFVMNLQRGEGLAFYLLSQLQQSGQDMTQILLHYMYSNPGQALPPNIINWIHSFPGGDRLLAELLIPGQITCFRDQFGRDICHKLPGNGPPKLPWPQRTTTPEPPIISIKPVPNEEIELHKIIEILINNRQLPALSYDIIKYITKNPDFGKLVEQIFLEFNISKKSINPDDITSILEILSFKDNAVPIDSISARVLKILVNLEYTPRLEYLLRTIFNSILTSNTDLLLLLKDLIKGLEGPIPTVLLQVIRELPQGEQILESILNPELVTCKHNTADKTITCIDLSIEFEIRNLITDLTNNQLDTLPQNVIKFIENQPNLLEYIITIFDKYKISRNKIDPETILTILKIIADINNKTSKTPISNEMLDIASKLEGTAAQDFVNYVFNWTKNNTKKDIKQIILQIMFQANTEKVPANILSWLITTEEGQIILEELSKPGKINCETSVYSGLICTKTPESRIPGNAPEKIKIELEEIIRAIIEDNKLDPLPPGILDLIITQPKEVVETIIETIFEIKGYPQIKINPELIYQILELLMNIEKGEQILKIDPSVIEIILKLEGAQKVSQIVLDWVQRNKSQDMLGLFLEVVKNNGGTKIPQNLYVWLLNLPNGEQIIKYLQMPGEITCERYGNQVKCTKRVVHSIQ